MLYTRYIINIYLVPGMILYYIYNQVSAVYLM